jgi:O-methyltransferase
MLDRATRRTGLFLARSPIRAERAVDHRRFTVDSPWSVHTDYVRFGTTELLIRRIVERGVAGAVAEVGVYYGYWARAVNHHLPDRAMYLFDTWEGFDARDLAAEQAIRPGADQPYEVDVWSPDRVVASLPHPEHAIIRRGWFPETATGLEAERFCLVDIDVGLHGPTMAALEWFYPRMAPGGYISIVDYGNAHTAGVRVAVEDFVARVGCSIVTLPDRGASAWIAIPPGPTKDGD